MQLRDSPLEDGLQNGNSESFVSLGEGLINSSTLLFRGTSSWRLLDPEETLREVTLMEETGGVLFTSVCLFACGSGCGKRQTGWHGTTHIVTGYMRMQIHNYVHTYIILCVQSTYIPTHTHILIIIIQAYANYIDITIVYVLTIYHVCMRARARV